MKTIKTQPTSYKDFIQQMSKAKATKLTPQSKTKETPPLNNSHSIAPGHAQSTCLWDHRSPSHSKRLATDLSSDKRIRSYNISQNQSYNQSHNQSHNQSTQLQTKSIKMSKKDKELSYNKFVSETTLALTRIFKTPVPELLSNRISYIEYLEALKSLKMIYDTYEPYPCDLVSELWSECISGQNVGNFIITTCAILGLYETKQSEEDKYLKNKYESLRYTRLELNKASLNDSYKQNDCTFMPQISDRSRKLATSASKSRPKKMDMQNVQAPTDRNKTSMEQSQNFNTNNGQFKDKFDLTGNKRSQLLYQRAKQKSCERRENRSTNDIEYQKYQRQLTFKPAITKVKTKQAPKCSVKGQRNTISRMIRGRVEREVRKIINEKGVPYNDKIVDKMRKQKYEQITSTTNFDTFEESVDIPDRNLGLQIVNSSCPTAEPRPQPSKNVLQNTEQDIVIDVYLTEEHKQKLVVRRGQNLEQLASAFIEKHGIGSEKKQQLIQLLQVSLSHALCPIDELVDEEDELASARTHHNKREHCR